MHLTRFDVLHAFSSQVFVKNRADDLCVDLLFTVRSNGSCDFEGLQV